MESYSVRDVERVLRLPRSTIQGLIRSGFVQPTRGPRRQYRFSFQDLIVLRTARALSQAKVPSRRIRRALEDLRQHLPDTAPLSGLSIRAIGDRVVVREGQAQRQVEDGQYVLDLDVSVAQGELRVVEHREPPTAEPGEEPADWFRAGLELEESDPRAAVHAYERAVEADPQQPAAWINWGRLLHEQGGKRDAESVYLRGLRACGPDPLLMFNLGVVLEDMDRPGAALEAYQSALEEDPELADCHYNLARLYDTLGKPQHAIRHLGQYRRLVLGELG
ncbi:MAG TPA: tetratricopeptide repeat protein [Steroidobacteraceae bacterium]|nr:tetratricopeptide repeat protein [Steroidobacteraceae bacterium]